jgi:uncharacterized protein (DUF1330 family)
MTALLSVTIEVKDPERLKEYISKVPATMAPHGAKMLSRGKVAQTLNGEVKHQIEAVFEFPSAEHLEAWYTSDAYQAIIPLRDEACQMRISVLQPF